jgi:tetratricopeptide (TPR) repeat protein
MNVDSRISGGRKVRLQLGVSLILTGKLTEAESVFGDILARNSRDTDALNNLAIAYRLQGKLYDALDALLNAINIDPVKAETQYNLGKVYKQLGNFKSAAMACAKAVENDPTFIPAYINLGAAYYLLKEFGKAANFLKEGLAMDPANRFLQANYHAALEAKRVSESADTHKSALSADDIPAGDSPETEIFEAGDIFTGVPVGDIVSRRIAALRRNRKSSATSGAEPSYTLTGVTGLLGYLLELATFLPPPARKTFEEQGIGRLIESTIGSLSRIISGPVPVANPAPVTVSRPNNTGAFVASLAGMLGLFDSFLQDLPRTEQQNTLKRKIEDILEDLRRQF